MATNGTAGNDTWTIAEAGTYSINGLGGRDTVDMGWALRGDYSITLGQDGAIHVDSISAASGPGNDVRVTLRNVEVLKFNRGTEVIDLTVLFGDTTPPTVAITDNSAGTALGPVTYTLNFSETVSAPAVGDFTVSNGNVLSVTTNNPSSYSVLVAPIANAEGSMAFSLKSASVADLSGNVNAETAAAPQAFDTRAPSVGTFSPTQQASAVAVGANIVLTFSEAVQRGTGNLLLKDGSGNSVISYNTATSANLSLSGSTLTINPSADLAAGTTYTLEGPAGLLRDAAGNGWAGPGGYRFTTAINPANPTLSGSAANDALSAVTGALAVNGLGGIDILALPQARGAYTISAITDGWRAQANDGSSNTTLTQVERLAFADIKLAFDLNGNAGTVAKILGAVFGPASVGNQIYAGIGLQLMDGGMGYEALMQLAIDAALGAGAPNAVVVSLLYTNVVGAPPGAADLAYFVGLLDRHEFTPATLGILAADHVLNIEHINLVGLTTTGLAYVGG